MRRLLPFAFATLIGTNAFAQDSSRAQALFDEGRHLMNEGRYAEACPKLAASQRLDPGAGTLMNLATCYDKNGQVASAWATFIEAASASKAANHPEWEVAARGRAEKLQGDVPRLVVVPPKDVSGLVVERDGRALDAAELGTSMPIDPGPHTLRAHAPGRKPWSTEIQMTSLRLQVVVPALENASASSTEVPPAVGENRSSGDTQRLLGVVAAGGGLVALGIGTFFGLAASSTNDDALAECNAARQCNSRGLALRDDATAQATASTVFFVAGGALVAAGAVLYFTAPKLEKAHVALTGSGLIAGGSF